MKAITATLTRCRHGQPLVVLESQPFNGLELTPRALQDLAAHLLAIADAATRLNTGRKHFTPSRLTVGGTQGEGR